MSQIANGFSYTIKRKVDETTGRYKSWLIAKNIIQRYGINYEDAFSPIVKGPTRVALSISISKGWCLRQLDVQNSFLHGNLEDDIYMKQSPSYEHQSFPNYVCKLDKALYGLKQDPREWYSRLSEKLQKLGFTPSRANISLFFYNKGGVTILLLIYVNDISVARSSQDVVLALLKNLEV